MHPIYPPPPPYTPEEAMAFWSQVRRKRGCWLWQGPCTPAGLPYFLLRDTCVAQRAAWQLLYGPAPRGTARVIPRCSNLRCVRPDHLTLTTPRVRILPYGTGYAPAERWPGLTPADEQAIRRAFRTGHLTYRDLAEEFGCARSTILRALRRRFWCRAAPGEPPAWEDPAAGVSEQIGG